MPKRNRHSQKAREHEAAKRGEIIPAIRVRTYAKEIGADPTNEDSGNDFDDIRRYFCLCHWYLEAYR